jgi:predicted DNA-binding transcriptional regulator YafY
MSLKIGYLQRYLIIIKQIRRKKYISMDKLVDAVRNEIAHYVDTDRVGLSERSIQRDLKEIKDNLNIGIKYSKANNGYFIPEDDDAQSNFEMMVEQLNLLGTLYMDKKLTEFLFPEKRKPKGMEHLPPLIHAIKNSLVTEFFYRKYDNSLSHTRKVEPYALKESQGRWYLLAMEIDGRLEESGCIKTWGLDRIQDLTITNNRFLKNPDYDVEKEFAGSFGIHSDKDKETEEIILSFSSMGGKYNESFPLHESQETIVDNEHEFRIVLRVKITYDFIMELLSQCENMKVIAPVHLRNKLIEIHREAIKMLESDKN